MRFAKTNRCDTIKIKARTIGHCYFGLTSIRKIHEIVRERTQGDEECRMKGGETKPSSRKTTGT